MKKIGIDIIEDNNIGTPIKTRTTVRAIIINAQFEICMLYSRFFDDYTFPGGGVHNDETQEKALKRELREELGAHRVEVLNPVGYTREIRYGISGSNAVYEQTSYYYVCKIDDIRDPEFVEREHYQKLETVWVKIEDAISHNTRVVSDEKHQKKGLKTVLLRENMVLKYIMEEMLNEKI